MLFYQIFVGAGVEGFWRDFDRSSWATPSARGDAPAGVWVASLPTVTMAIGFAVAWCSTSGARTCPTELARQQPLLYQFLLNKWYFDEIYDFLFVRPTLWLGRLLWKGGDGWIIDGLGPDGVSARVLDATRNVVRLQTGYLYHYAFAMLIGVVALITWFMFVGGRPLMASWPILSVVTFLPLVGAILSRCMRGEDASVARNARWIALWTTLITFASR